MSSEPRKGQFDFDVAFFEHVLRISPRHEDVLRALGDLLAYKKLYGRALEVDRRLAAVRPRDPVARYNLACSLARCGHRDEAIAELAAALDRGYDDLKHLTADPDLASLRSESAFLDLLSRYARHASQRG